LFCNKLFGMVTARPAKPLQTGVGSVQIKSPPTRESRYVFCRWNPTDMAAFSSAHLDALRDVMRAVILETVPPLIQAAIAPLAADIAVLKADVADLKARVGHIKVRLDHIEVRLDHMDARLAQSEARQGNATKGPTEPLETIVSARREACKHAARARAASAEAALAAALAAVPVDHAVVTAAQEDVDNARVARDEAERDATVPPFPPTIAHLLVAGSERLPFSPAGTRNTWNRTKSRDLLQYLDGAMPDYGSDAEDGATARRHRIQVGERLGVSRHTLSAMLSASVAVDVFAV